MSDMGLMFFASPAERSPQFRSRHRASEEWQKTTSLAHTFLMRGRHTFPYEAAGRRLVHRDASPLQRPVSELDILQAARGIQSAPPVVVHLWSDAEQAALRPMAVAGAPTFFRKVQEVLQHYFSIVLM